MAQRASEPDADAKHASLSRRAQRRDALTSTRVRTVQQASHQSRAVPSLSPVESSVQPLTSREHSLEEHSGATLSRALASAQYSKPLISREQCQASHQSRAVYSLSLVESSKRAT